jgi:hypothetical protein
MRPPRARATLRRQRSTLGREWKVLEHAADLKQPVDLRGSACEQNLATVVSAQRVGDKYLKSRGIHEADAVEVDDHPAVAGADRRMQLFVQHRSRREVDLPDDDHHRHAIAVDDIYRERRLQAGRQRLSESRSFGPPERRGSRVEF